MQLRLLMVEDSESDAKLIVRSLVKSGYEVFYERVENASQMKSVLIDQVWDVIICDYSLPDFDAPRALELLKQQTMLDIPFLVVSGTIGEDIAVTMMKAGAHDYLMKDNLTRLVPAIEREMRDARVRKERRLADEALRISERKYRILAENTQDIIYQVDAEGNFTYVSPMVSRYGYEQKDVIGHNLVEFIHPDDCRKLLKEFEKTITTGLEIASQFRIKNSLNLEIWIEEIGKVLRDKEGEIVGVTGVLRDITDRNKAEMALRISEERYRRMARCSPDMIWISNLSGQYIYISPAVERLYGWTVDEVMKMSLGDLIPPIHAERSKAMIEEELALVAAGNYDHNRVKIFEAEELRKDGSMFWSEVSSSFLWSDDNKPAGIIGITRDITERRKTEQLLRDSEMRFRALAENSLDTIMRFDARGRHLYVNPVVERQTGIPAAEFIGKTHAGLGFPRELTTLWENAIQTVFRTKTMERVDFKLPNNVWIDWMLVPELDEKGSVRAVMASGRDITEFMQMQFALIESETRNRSIVAAMPDLILRIDSNNRFLDCQSANKNLLLLPPEQIVGKSIGDVLPPQLAGIAIQKVQETISSGQLQVFEYDLVVDGVNRFHESRMMPCGPDAVISIVRDVTDRRKAEHALRESEERWHFALEGAGDGVWDWNVSTNKVYFSKQWKNMLGYAEDEIGDFLDEWKKRIHPDDIERCLADLERHFNGETPVYQNEHRMLCKDGTYKWILDRGKVVERAENGKPLRVIGIHSDITQRKHAEERELWQQEQLLRADKLASLGTLVAGVAHEINNPNMFIMLNASALEETLKRIMSLADNFAGVNAPDREMLDELRKDAEETFRNILQGAERIKHIVEELKEFSKDKPLELKEDVDVNRVIRSAITLTWNKIKNATDNFRFEEEKNIPLIKGSPQKLEQVIINLLVNACEAMNDRRKKLTVSSIHDKASSRVIVKIKDEGAGMSQYVLQRIKEPFFTTKKDTGGTGLGIPISSQIIEKHGGQLDFESTPKQGTTAVILLPVKDGKD